MFSIIKKTSPLDQSSHEKDEKDEKDEKETNHPNHLAFGVNIIAEVDGFNVAYSLAATPSQSSRTHSRSDCPFVSPYSR